MKLYKIPTKRPVHQGAFTLIEMIGVLAVIAILAAMLIPKVFQAINNARVNNAAVSCDTVKTATADHYGKYGKLDQVWGTNGVTFNAQGVSAGYDTNLLMVEGLIDKPFFVKIAGGDPSANSILELCQNGKDNNGAGYLLDGVNNGTTNAQFVLEAKILNVAIADAKDLNDLIDGTSLGAGNLTTADTKGRVEYVTPTNGATTVFVYLTHR